MEYLFEQLKDTKMINAVGKFNINVFNNIESVNLLLKILNSLN